jgi:hypothetical protein
MHGVRELAVLSTCAVTAMHVYSPILLLLCISVALIVVCASVNIVVASMY